MQPIHATQKDFLFLSSSLFVVVMAWIGFNLYHAWVTSTISADLQLQIIPIQGRFDTVTLEKLKTRKKIAPVFTSSSLIATPTASLSPTPSESVPTITGTPTPTTIQSEITPTETTEEDIIPTEIPTPTP